MADTKEQGTTSVIDRVKLEPPRMWNVILWNDNFTTMEFVVLVLMQIFHKSFEDAQDCMMDIHESGKGIAGTYSNEVASEKMRETLLTAESHGFPLKVTIEQA